MLGAVLVISLLAGACSTAPGEDADAASVELDLAAVSLASDSVEELGQVRLTGIDPRADLSEVGLALKSDDIEVPLPIYGGDEPYSVVPLHPGSPGDGGQVVLQMTHGDDDAELPLSLTGLPAAPGAWDQAIAGFRDALDRRARAAGSSFDQVMASDPDQLDGELLLVWIVGSYVDDGTDEDLESLLATSDLDEDQRALLDAVIAQIDPLSAVRDVDELPGLVTSAVGPIHPAPAPGAHTPSTPAGHQVVAQAGSCQRFDLKITNGEELADAIATGVDSQIVEGGAVDKVMKDTAALGSMVGEVPVLGEMASLAGTLQSLLSLLWNADAGRYPTQLESLQVKITADEFNEDFTEPGQVTDVKVTAVATGFDGAQDLAEIAADLAAMLLGAALNHKRLDDALDDDMKESITISSSLRQAVVTEALAQMAAEHVTWCPQTWVVDITSSRWVDLISVENIEDDRSQLTYKPTAVGSGTLRIIADPAAFSGVSTSRDVPITTHGLTLDASPLEISVDEPGETAKITATLQHADTTTLFWEPEQGEFVDGIGFDTNDDGQRPLATPTDSDLYPFDVTITSTSRTGLRAKATDERTATVRIKLQDLVVSPPEITVAPGETVDYTATDPDGDPVEVRWEATGGDIDDDGQYVAGDEKGTFTVTATAVDDPNRTSTVQVTISEVEPCTFRLSYNGSVQSEEGGYSGPVSGAASFSIDEYTGDTGRPEHGGMTALNFADSQTRVEELTVLTLGDQTPQFVLVGLLGPDGLGLPLGTTGAYIRSGGIQIHPSGVEESFEFTGDFGITITESVLGESDGVPVIQRLAGTFESLGHMEVVDPFDQISGSVVVTGGEFSVDREACSEFVP